MAMTVTGLVWLIGIHSIIHGIFGIVFVQTSHYVNFSPEINHALTALYGVLIILGVMVFCVIMCRLPMCAIVFAVLFALLALAIIVTSIVYTIKYFNFFANCILDVAIFYSDSECWCGPDHLLSIWHFITILMIVITFIWFIYACLLCKYARCVCNIPCPPPACYKPPTCPPCQPCCHKERWYKRIFKSKCQPDPVCCPPPCPPPCPLPCPPPCSPVCPPPCSPCPKKNHKFVLTLRPGKLCK